MSFLFGGVRRRGDPELEAGNRRFREHIARDINDERTLASSGEPPIRRGSHWLWFGGAVVVAVVLALVHRGTSDDVPLAADCAHPGLALGERSVTAGTPLHFRLTGPDHTRFVVELDGAAIRGDAGSLVQYIDTPTGPAFELQQCLSPTLVVAAPAGNGRHELELLRVGDDGKAQQLEAVSFDVVGTR